ncbi:MAG: PilN domain-containing protein [Acholeplasmataceae bacterium]|nr:PilN domain-containing protein [Acholeplasmataceae bacterium]
MIRINLLPESRRKKVTPQHKYFLLATYCVLALTVLFWGYSLGMLKYTEGKLRDAEGSIAAMHVWQERYELNLQQLAELNKRNTMVANLAKERLLWSRSLGELGNLTPYGCWLVSVAQDKAKPSEVSLKGKALSMDNILEFIGRLQQEPGITSVDLIETNSGKAASTAGAANVIDFSLKLQKSEVAKK